MSTRLPEQILTTVASLVTIGFGVWHFFVPEIWNWYSYIDEKAPELVLAVRAINIFFSLSLVLFGCMNILLLFGRDPYSVAVVLSATCLLWIARVIVQIVYPQGSANPVLQYGMLTVFLLTFLSFAGALSLVLFRSVSER